jgi:hypothetical protein
VTLFDRFGLMATLFPARAEAAKAAARWSKAATREPDLIGDLIRLSGLMEITPDTYDERTGLPLGDPVDANRALIQQGRQDMARQMLALMSVTPYQLQKMMEDEHDVS